MVCACLFMHFVISALYPCIQTAGVPPALLCDSGGTERSVSGPCPWIQEGNFVLVYDASGCVNNDLYMYNVLMNCSSPQIILSTNIAESSVTVPDVKYGNCFASTLTFLFLGSCTQCSFFSVASFCSDWFLPGSSFGLWQRDKLPIPKTHLGIKDQLEPAARYNMQLYKTLWLLQQCVA